MQLNPIGGIATGTYQFQTVFCGLTDMPADFQKLIDVTIPNCKNIYPCSDDKKVRKISVELHEETLKTVLRKLDEENIAISLDKCKFAKTKIEWLGYNINNEGTKTLIYTSEATKN